MFQLLDQFFGNRFVGAPWHLMQDLVRQHGIIGLSSNYTLYGDMSNRIMTILCIYSPNVEVYSIDESFLNLAGMSGLWATPTVMGQDICARILQWTALPVCVGIGASKTLAKLTNHVGKKFSLFDGVCDFTSMSAARDGCSSASQWEKSGAPAGASETSSATWASRRSRH